MEVTQENYYTNECNQEYMSVHQFLDFVGYLGIRGCEERALATLDGTYVPETTKPMLIGSYVDSHFVILYSHFAILHMFLGSFFSPFSSLFYD